MSHSPLRCVFSCGSLRFFFILPNFPLQVQERAYKIIDRSLGVLVFSPSQTLCNKKARFPVCCSMSLSVLTSTIICTASATITLIFRRICTTALNSCVYSPAHWPVRWKPSSTKFTPAKPCWCCRTKSTATAPLANLRACYGCFLTTGCQNLFLSWASGSLSALCSAWKLRP